jgi:hypothetical protein
MKEDGGVYKDDNLTPLGYTGLQSHSKPQHHSFLEKNINERDRLKQLNAPHLLMQE